MSPTLPMKRIVIDGTERKKYYRKKNLGGQMSYQSYGRSGARQKNSTVRVAIILRGNYVSSFD